MTTFDLIGEAVLSTQSDAIIEADRDGIIGFWNPGAERIFGFTSNEAIGQSLDLIIPERLRQRHWEGFDQTLRTGKSRYGAGDVLVFVHTGGTPAVFTWNDLWLETPELQTTG